MGTMGEREGGDRRAELARRIAAGEYVVDPEAVAEAILLRRRARLSEMLVAAQLDLPPRGIDEHDPASGTDLS
jgi:hypothetical protein